MSLPEHARFYKNGKMVGIGFCNIGWFIQYDQIPKCIFNAWERAIGYYSEITETDEKIKERILKHRKQDKEYFTTREDLIGFTHVYLYSLCIDKDTVSELYHKVLSVDEFAKKCDDGSYRITRYYNPIGIKNE